MIVFLMAISISLLGISAYLFIKVRSLRQLAQSLHDHQINGDEKSRQSLSDLIHDLNSPLTLILGRTRQLLDTLERPTLNEADMLEAREWAYMIEKNTLKLDHILKNISSHPN